MKRFGVAAAQGQCPNILRIKRLPAHRNLWLLRVIFGAHTVLKWLQDRRSVLAVPFLPLGKINLEAIETPEVPRGAGERYPHFLVDCPDIPVHLEALPIHRAKRTKRVIERITIALQSRCVVLTANGKGNRTGGKIKQVAVERGVIQGQLIGAGIVQGDINSGSGRGRVRAKEAKEGIKRRGRVRIQ